LPNRLLQEKQTASANLGEDGSGRINVGNIVMYSKKSRRGSLEKSKKHPVSAFLLPVFGLSGKNAEKVQKKLAILPNAY